MEEGQVDREGGLLPPDDQQADDHLQRLRDEHGRGWEVHVPRQHARVAHADDEEGVLEREHDKAHVLEVGRICGVVERAHVTS